MKRDGTYRSWRDLQPVHQIQGNTGIIDKSASDDICVGKDRNRLIEVLEAKLFQFVDDARLNFGHEFSSGRPCRASEYVEAFPHRIGLQFGKLAARPLTHANFGEAGTLLDGESEPNRERPGGFAGSLERTAVYRCDWNASEAAGEPSRFAVPLFAEMDSRKVSRQAFADPGVGRMANQQIFRH